MKNLTAPFSQTHGLIIPINLMKPAVIYPDLASVPTPVVSNDLAFFLAFLCFTPEYVNCFQETIAVFIYDA